MTANDTYSLVNSPASHACPAVHGTSTNQYSLISQPINCNFRNRSHPFQISEIHPKAFTMALFKTYISLFVTGKMIGILLKHHLYLTFANSAKNGATFLIPTSFKPNLSISLNNSIPSPSRITRPPIPHYDRRSTSNRPRPPQLYSTVI